MWLRIFRYLASPLAGIAVFLFMMDTLTGYVLPVDFISITVLATCYALAAFGGLVSAAIAPRFKVLLATVTGAVFPVAYLGSVLFANWPENSDPLSFDVLWSLGLPVFFLVGGSIGKRITKAPG